MVLWIVLAVLTCAAVLAVLSPLSRPAAAPERDADGDVQVYRDQLREIDNDLERGLIEPAEAEAARIEISRRMLAAGEAGEEAAAPAMRMRPVALGAVVAVPLASLALYLALGAPELPGQPLAARLADPAAQQDVATLVLRVETHLAQDPEDGRGWEVLAPVYGRLGRHTEAVRAWRNAIRLLGGTQERYASLGEAVVASEDGLITEDAREAFETALAEDETAPRPRFYLAIAAEQDGDWPAAIARWEALLADAPITASWRDLVAERMLAAQLQGQSAREEPGPDAADIAAAATMGDDDRAEMVAGMVDGLAARLAEDGDDLHGWLRLMRAYAVLGDTEKAREAVRSARRNFAADDDAEARIDAAARALGLES